jgi:hypothetical protein
MRLPLTLSVSAPTAGDHLENLALLGCGLLLLVIALSLCSFVLDRLSKVFEASADWLEHRAARRRKRRRACLKKHYPPVARASHLRPVPSPPDDTLARNALERNAEAHRAGRSPAVRGQANLRLVKPRGKA